MNERRDCAERSHRHRARTRDHRRIAARQLEALAIELAGAGRGASAGAVVAPAREPRHGFNAITIAYALGGLLVVFALAWFLLERWKILGPGGVLGVSLLYAAAFVVVGTVVRRRGFEIAGGLTIVLAVAMTPVWTWAILRLTGEMPDPAALDNALSRYDPYIATRLIVLELATIGVGLVAARRVRPSCSPRRSPPRWWRPAAYRTGVRRPTARVYTGPYYQCVVACAMLAVAYAVERRQPAEEDYAFWFYLAGVIMLFVAYSQVWPYIGRWRHALPSWRPLS